MINKTLKQKIYEIIFEADTPAGKWFDISLLWVIILSIFCVILESDRQISQSYFNELRILEWSFTILFTIEYLLRIFSAKNTKKYILSFFGVVDFIAIVPGYLSLFIVGTQYLLVIRALRLLRVFRILKLARYLQESQMLINALKASRIKITVFLGAVITIVLIAGTLMHIIERENPGFSSIFQGMYWAIVTMTTVGYGDVVPTTIVGKVLSSIIMILGYGIIAVPTGIVTAELTTIAQGSKRQQVCSHCKAVIASSNAKYCHQCGQAIEA